MITPGIELFTAIDECLAEGLGVSCVEVRSKKGVDGGTPRVVRVKRRENAAELLFAFFQCAPNPDCSEDK